MEEINYIHKERPLEFEIFPYKIKIFTIEKNKKFQYPDGKSDVFCCMDIEYTNLLNVQSINTWAHAGGLKLVDTKGHQYSSVEWPRTLEHFENENGNLISYWHIDSGVSKCVYNLVNGEIWGGVSTRGWILWPKIPEDAEIKRIIMQLEVVETKDKPGGDLWKGIFWNVITQHVAINVIY